MLRLCIYRLNERLLYGGTGPSPVKPLLPSRPKSAQAQSSRLSTRPPVRSRRKWRILTKWIGPQSQTATSRLLRRPFLLQAKLTTSSMLQRVSWRQHLELEIRQLYPPNKMNEHFSATTNQIRILLVSRTASEITALRLYLRLGGVVSFFFLPSDFISHLSVTVTIVGPPRIPCSSSRLGHRFFESACYLCCATASHCHCRVSSSSISFLSSYSKSFHHRHSLPVPWC